MIQGVSQRRVQVPGGTRCALLPPTLRIWKPDPQAAWLLWRVGGAGTPRGGTVTESASSRLFRAVTGPRLTPAPLFTNSPPISSPWSRGQTLPSTLDGYQSLFGPLQSLAPFCLSR